MAATELITAIKAALEQVERAVEESQRALSAGDLSLKDQVEIGQAAWRIAQRAQEVIDPLKASLRAEASQRLQGGPGRQFLSGRSRGSRCTVVIPTPFNKLRPDVNLRALWETLGPDFDTFFRFEVSPRPEFAERATERPDLLQTLAAVVDNDPAPATPRVTFND
jgi:hypothetical protein